MTKEIDEFWAELLSGSSDYTHECAQLLFGSTVATPATAERLLDAERNRMDDNLRSVFGRKADARIDHD